MDAVLLDLVMPLMDGFEFLRRHRAADGRAPVVVLSGVAGTSSVVKAMKLGAADYLPRPFAPAKLELVLRRALERRAPPPGAAAPAERLVLPLRLQLPTAGDDLGDLLDLALQVLDPVGVLIRTRGGRRLPRSRRGWAPRVRPPSCGHGPSRRSS